MLSVDRWDTNGRTLVVVDPDSGCWLWQGYVDKAGYARVGHRYIHREVCEAAYGPIPEGWTVDHVKARGCVHRHCINPEHLEAVTTRENVLRGDGPSAVAARQTHCIHGHEYTEANTYRPKRGGRICRCCRAAALRRLHARKRAGRG